MFTENKLITKLVEILQDRSKRIKISLNALFLYFESYRVVNLIASDGEE